MFNIGLDIETTGLEFGDHRIVEIYLGLWKPGTLKPVFEYEQRIDPQRSIALEAQRVHGISSGDLIGKPTWDVVGPIVHKILLKGSGYVWHNGDWFDGPFLEYELKRIGLDMPKLPTCDTMANGVWATPDGKKPNLGELCFACGIDYDPKKAHAAPYDVRDTMMPCFFQGVSWGFFQDPSAREKIAA